MNEITYLVAGGVVLMAVGIGLGYWVARLRIGKQAARAEDVQKELDDYRHEVSEHFGRTAEHFQAIGRQYRELYEHMASGADTLCDQEAMDEKLSFIPAAAIESRTGDAVPVEETASVPRDYADSDDISEIEKPGAEPVVADVAQEAEGESETATSTETPVEEVQPEAKTDAAGDDTRRTYH